MSSLDHRPAWGLGEDPDTRGLDCAARLVDVAECDVARLQDEGRGTGRHALVGVMHDDAPEHAAHHGDESFGLEDAQGLPQRRAGDAEALDEVGFATQ